MSRHWILHVLVSLFCITGRSERPSSRYARVLATEGTDGIRYAVDEAEAERCPEEESLRTVLRNLGIPESDLQGDLRKFPGVEWRSGGDSCAVHAIDPPGRPDLRGSLHPEIAELTELQILILDDTNVSGSLDVLANNTLLLYLRLRHTRVTGRLEALPKAKDLENLDLTGTEVTGDLAALANFTQLEYLRLANTAVSGELKSLAKLERLQTLGLSNTAVSGELKSLANATELVYLHLPNTAVSGELKSLEKLNGLRDLDLSNTAVSGKLKSLEKLKRLQKLELANLKVGGDVAVMAEWSQIEHVDLSGTEVEFDLFQQFEPFNRTRLKWQCKWQKLRFLDVSQTPYPQFSLAQDLLRIFAGCGKLATLKAAGCGLTGPLWPKIVDSNGYTIPIDGWPLSQVLSVLDFARNNVTDVAKLPDSCRTLVLTGNPHVSFGAGAVEKAIKDVVFIDLRNATFGNPSEATDLLDAGVVKGNDITRTVFNQTHGFACYDLVSTSLQVSPDKFAADRLCDCSPGWNGSGAQCQKCPANTFSSVYSSGECNPCPTGSKSSEGSTSRSSCICEVGVLDNSTGKCGCPKDEAKSSDICVKCQELFLNCSKPGAEVHSASPLPNYTRLGNESRAYKCLPPASRCNANLSDPGGASCAAGYAAPMCIQCNHDYFSHGQQCERCRTSNVVSNAVVVAAAILALAGLGGAFIWHRRNTEGHPTKPSCWTALAQQAKAQVPILLQLCQLWTILAMLASTLGPEDRDASKLSEYWELPYIQTLQLSISSLKDTVNLQCKFDGGWIRFTSAMASPVLPLFVLLLCLVPELVKPGSGIAAGLQVVTLLYIGGASSTSGLLSCQETDGAGDLLPKAFAYRKLMPDIFCHEDSQLKYRVDTLAFGCAFCYGIAIPCCLLFLYGKQHMVLEVNRTRTVVTGYQGDLHLWLHDILGSTTKKISGKDDKFIHPLIAAASAYISVLYRGRVQVQVVDGTAIVKQLGTDEGNDLPDLDLLSFVRVEDAKQRAKQLRCRSIAKMMTERTMLQDVAPRDRVLTGAKNLLLKYALCRNAWMEITQKLVAVGVVSAVSGTNGFQWCFAFTMMMAATSSMVQPYAQPQVNTLHSCSFLCLAVSAASFAYRWVWPARAALAIPFLLSAAQGLKPDSPESLAVRLWEDLERHVETLQRGEPVEVVAEIHSFV